jgi:hypothetical protein
MAQLMTGFRSIEQIQSADTLEKLKSDAEEVVQSLNEVLKDKARKT